MWHVIGAYVAPTLAEAGLKYLKHKAATNIELLIIEKVKTHIDIKLANVIDDINKRTIVYLVISIIGIIYINTNHLYDFKLYSKALILLVALTITIYFIYKSIKSFKQFFDFIHSFDDNIKTIIEEEIELAKGESLKNKFGIFVSQMQNKDIENIVIAYSARAMFGWIRDNNVSIIIRIINYSIILLLFDEIIEDILKV